MKEEAMNKPKKTIPSKGDNTRRRFLIWFTGIFSGIVGLVLGIPFIDSLIGPAFRKKTGSFARVISVAELPKDSPDDVKYTDTYQDAFIHGEKTRDIWAIKHSPTDVTVFSPVCPHLGCRYDWHPGREEFVCPCHGSMFSKEGKVVGGPAPRPLDTLPNRIENGDLFVKWERFRPGTSKKIIV
jgi:menaquinol-cytochrome c reductase iron-sulfur subunit